MALRHKKYNVSGVQFHPESIMTEYGKELLSNFLENAINFQAKNKKLEARKIEGFE